MRRLDRRVVNGHAFVAAKLGVFDDQNGVLGRQPDQSHDANLRVDVVVIRSQIHGQQRAEQA